MKYIFAGTIFKTKKFSLINDNFTEKGSFFRIPNDYTMKVMYLKKIKNKERISIYKENNQKIINFLDLKSFRLDFDEIFFIKQPIKIYKYCKKGNIVEFVVKCLLCEIKLEKTIDFEFFRGDGDENKNINCNLGFCILDQKNILIEKMQDKNIFNVKFYVENVGKTTKIAFFEDKLYFETFLEQ